MLRLGAALRTLQDRVSRTGASSELALQAAEDIERIAEQLEPYMYDVASDASWDDLARGRGTSTIVPEWMDLVCDGRTLTASVEFTPFHLGANGAVHGGVLPLFLGSVLATLVNTGRPLCRTAWLRVDYRNITPVGRPLLVRAHVESIEGRKHLVRAFLHDDDVLCAEAAGLYIQLRADAA